MDILGSFTQNVTPFTFKELQKDEYEVLAVEVQ